MPGAGRNPWPPCSKKARGRNHRFSQIIRHSLRDGFNAYGALSLGTGLSCSHRPRDHHLANLASASGDQDHALSPSAPTMLVRHHPRVHRMSAPRVVTIAIRPLHRGGVTGANHIFLKNGIRIFLRQALDNRISVESPHEIRFLAHVIQPLHGPIEGVPHEKQRPARANQPALHQPRRETSPLCHLSRSRMAGMKQCATPNCDFRRLKEE